MYNENETELEKNGYLLFRNATDIGNVYSSFSNDGKLDYDSIKKYIENVMLDTVDKNLNWKSDYIKFRVSDNNNSSDASTFHRDIIAQKNEILPSFTVLSYLDSTIMEIISESHKDLFISYTDLMKTYKKKKQIYMNPGDILIFYSTLLHRGIFTENTKSRKLIQVFEVFPSQNLLLQHKDKFVHVEGEETYSGFMQFISKYSLPIYFINFIGYINAATGYGNLPKEYLPENIDCMYLSSEGLRGREIIKKNTWQPSNKYIIKYETILLDKNNKTNFNHYCYNRTFSITIFIFLLAFIFFIYIVFISIKKITIK